MMGTDPTIAAARLVWDWIERGRLARFTVREAFNALRGTFPRVSKLRDALDALEERLRGSDRAAARRPRPAAVTHGTGAAGDREGLAMSWRETLGIAEVAGEPRAHNPHNAQKTAMPDNSADSADSASPDADEAASRLLEALSDACRRWCSCAPAKFGRRNGPKLTSTAQNGATP